MGYRPSDPKDLVATTPVTTAPAAQVARRGPGRVAAFVALTKPRIIELLLVTTVPVMFLAARGVPSLTLVLATLVGGVMSAGAANTRSEEHTAELQSH